MSDDPKANWTARATLTYAFADPISDEAWATLLTTVRQLGTPGLEGDVWEVELADEPDGVTSAALKVFRADFDMQHECLDPIMVADDEGVNVQELVEPNVRSFTTEATFDVDHPFFLKPYAFGRMANRNVILMPLIKGENMSEFLEKNPDLSLEHRLKFASLLL